MNARNLNEVHFDKLVGSGRPTFPWKGATAKAWADRVQINGQTSIPDVHHDRATLRAFCNETPCPQTCFAAVMSWGGMRAPNGKKAWESKHEWLPIIGKLKSGQLSRREAYERFALAAIPGLGPAYFTKLIFFIRPEANGYILDQWTGKSITIIYGAGAVKFDGHYISRRTSADEYERFCLLIEDLASRLGMEADATEDLIFSRGRVGKTAPAEWRGYVKEVWATLPSGMK